MDKDIDPKQRAQNFMWRHADVFSCRHLKNGMFSVRLVNGTPWPAASHGLTPEEAYEQAKLDRVTKKLMS